MVITRGKSRLAAQGAGTTDDSQTATTLSDSIGETTSTAILNSNRNESNKLESPVKKRRGKPRKNEVKGKLAVPKTSITDLLKKSAIKSKVKTQQPQEQQEERQATKKSESLSADEEIDIRLGDSNVTHIASAALEALTMEEGDGNDSTPSVRNDTTGVQSDQAIDDDSGKSTATEARSTFNKNENNDYDNDVDDDDDADGDFDMDVDNEIDNNDDEDFKPESGSSDSEPEAEVELDEEEEEVIQETQTQKKRGRKKGSKNKKPEERKPLVEKKPRQPTLRTVRFLRDLTSVEEKIVRLYTRNEVRLLELAKIKRAWEKWLFNFPIGNIQPDFPLFIPITSPCQRINPYGVLRETRLRESQYHIINSQEYKSLFVDRPHPLKVNIHDLDTKLRANEKVEIPVLPYYTRTALVMNVGGLITDIAWLLNNNDDDNEPLYLAVSVSQYYDEPSSQYLEVFDKEEHISAIKIYKLDPSTLRLTNIQTIVHPYGETWDLKWHDGYKSDEAGRILGLLGLVCQDGSVKFMEIDFNEDSDTVYKLYDNVKLSFSIDETSATCFDFLTPTTIICGFKNGFIAEFDLSCASTIPSYYHRLHESYIVRIVAAYSTYESTAVASVSLDGFFHIFDPRDIYSSKITPIPRFRGNLISPMTYCPLVCSVVFSDSVSSIRASVPRAAFAVHQISSRPSTITALHGSRVHPLVLSSTSDGALYVDNIMRRLLATVKIPVDAHKSLKLWKWDFDLSTDTYRLDFNYETTKCSVNDTRQMRIDPHGTSITCVKWNETYRGGKFYAFGNAAGLLTIEQLGPVE